MIGIQDEAVMPGGGPDGDEPAARTVDMKVSVARTARRDTGIARFMEATHLCERISPPRFFDLAG